MTAAVLLGIGYTNFSTKSPKELSLNTVSTSSSNNIGDVQLVSSSATVVENDNTNQVTNTSSKLVENNVVETSSNNSTFTELKMEREEMYSKSLETYQKIVDSSEVSSEQKAIAVQEIQKITNLRNAIQMSEELIKLKGFDDVVIYCSNDKISVIVRIAALSDSQIAQIQNIVSKELGANVSDITISNK